LHIGTWPSLAPASSLKNALTEAHDGEGLINYRREDAAYAGRIQDRSEGELGPDLLFIDVASRLV
jgi:hypothetical protein